ncbi:MAG: hypothetical protein AB7H96_15850 [Vicinamibacterales bacterium]
MDLRLASQTFLKASLTQTQKTAALAKAGVDVLKLLPTSYNFSLGARAMYHAASKSALIVNGYVNPIQDHCICWAGLNGDWRLYIPKPAGLSAATEVTYLVTLSGHLNLPLSVPIEIKKGGTPIVVTTALPQGDFALPIVTKTAHASVWFEYDHKASNIPFVLTNAQIEAFTTT